MAGTRCIYVANPIDASLEPVSILQATNYRYWAYLPQLRFPFAERFFPSMICPGCCLVCSLTNKDVLFAVGKLQAVTTRAIGGVQNSMRVTTVIMRYCDQPATRVGGLASSFIFPITRNQSEDLIFPPSTVYSGAAEVGSKSQLARYLWWDVCRSKD